MTDPPAWLTAALADRSRIARDIGLASMVAAYLRALNRKPPEVACTA